MWLRCDPSLRHVVRRPRIRRFRGWSSVWPTTSPQRWPRCGRLGPLPARAWKQAGAPLVREEVVADLDATLITVHAEKETAAKTSKERVRISPNRRLDRSWPHRYGRAGRVEHYRRSPSHGGARAGADPV